MYLYSYWLADGTILLPTLLDAECIVTHLATVTQECLKSFFVLRFVRAGTILRKRWLNLEQYFPKCFQFIIRTCGFNFKVLSFQFQPLHVVRHKLYRLFYGLCNLFLVLLPSWTDLLQWIAIFLCFLGIWAHFLPHKAYRLKSQIDDTHHPFTTAFLHDWFGAVRAAHRRSRSKFRKRAIRDSCVETYVTRWSRPPSVYKNKMDLLPISIVSHAWVEFSTMSHRWRGLKNSFLQYNAYLTIIPWSFDAFWDINTEDDTRNYLKAGKIMITNLKLLFQGDNDPPPSLGSCHGKAGFTDF